MKSHPSLQFDEQPDAPENSRKRWVLFAHLLGPGDPKTFASDPGFHTMRLPKKLAVASVLFLLIPCISVVAYQLIRVRKSDAVLDEINSLGTLAPSEVSELEWKIRIFITHDLHCAIAPQLNAKVTWLDSTYQFIRSDLRNNRSVRKLDELWEMYAQIDDTTSASVKYYATERDKEVKKILKIAAKDPNHPYVLEYLLPYQNTVEPSDPPKDRASSIQNGNHSADPR